MKNLSVIHKKCFQAIKIYIFQMLAVYVPTCIWKTIVHSRKMGGFFLAKSPVSGKAKHPTGREDTFFRTSVSPRHYDQNLNLVAFLQYSVSCSKSLLFSCISVYVQSCTTFIFSFHPGFHRICSNPA